MSSKKKQNSKGKKSRKKKTNVSLSFQQRFQEWWENRNLPMRFVGVFIFLMGVFYAYYFSDFHTGKVHPHILSTQAAIGVFLINIFDDSVVAVGELIKSDSFTMLVSGGCDGIEVTALLVASILAFPSTWNEKWKGLLVGVGILTVLNILRLPVLYWAGAKVSESLFDFLHVQGGFILFISISMLIWGIWIIRVLNNRKNNPVLPT